MFLVILIVVSKIGIEQIRVLSYKVAGNALASLTTLTTQGFLRG
jgi:hypothetical protein